jgi:hypothetical protein
LAITQSEKEFQEKINQIPGLETDRVLVFCFNMTQTSFSVAAAVAVMVATFACCCSGQRLSQGASDWYMRFHDFDRVRRNFDHPITKSFHVETVVANRYAVTKVTTLVHNPANVRQMFSFGFATPKTAFVSNVTLQDYSGHVIVRPTFNESDWFAHREDADDLERKEADGNGNGHHPAGLGTQKDKLDAVFNELADFRKFVLPIHLPPKDNITLTFVFEYLLERRGGRYVHSVSISPGEIVADFRIRLSIEEDPASKMVESVNITAPVIGDITKDANVTADGAGVSVDFSMSEIEQFHYFGSHGFTGDLIAEFDVATQPGHLDLAVTADGAFLQFYDLPVSKMRTIPKHVVFVIDNSDSMRGPKLDDVKESTRLLLNSLDDRDFVNLVVFDASNTFSEWMPNSVMKENNSRAISATENVTSELVEFVNQLQSNGSDGEGAATFNLSAAVEQAILLQNSIDGAGDMPKNTYTLVVVLTDGRGYVNRTAAKEARKDIRNLNKTKSSGRLPLFMIGMGFDANMNFLDNVAAKSGGCAVNIIEDLEVEPQLTEISRHLNDVVLKDLRLKYNDHDIDDLTRTYFNAFLHGGSVAVAGRWMDDPKSPFSPEIELQVTGHSFYGPYLEFPATGHLVPEEECIGSIRLCSELRLNGKCVAANMSRSDLEQFDFSARAASLEITGECAWAVFDLQSYGGTSMTLMPGLYEAIPDLHRSIRSFRMVPVSRLAAEKAEEKKGEEEEQIEFRELATQDPVSRAWAFITLHDMLGRLESNPATVSHEDVVMATYIALKFNFLTPFTDLYMSEEVRGVDGGDAEYSSQEENGGSSSSEENSSSEEEEEEEEIYDPDYQVEPSDSVVVENNYITFRDLNPVFVTLDDPDIARQWEALKACEPPIKCQGNFHFEELVDEKEEEEGGERGQENSFTSGTNCTGNISLFTKADFEGERLDSSVSLHQLYHSVNSQRLRSIRADGDCCWLLFDLRFFSGRVERLCGSFDQPLRVTNIGSVKKIGAMTT